MADEVFVPHLRRVTRDFDPSRETKLQRVDIPLPNRTLGAAGPAIEVSGREEFPLTPLMIPFTAKDVTGIDVASVRVFRVDKETGQFRPIWNSGANETLGYVWANVGRPGVYVPIGRAQRTARAADLRQRSAGTRQCDSRARRSCSGCS